MAKSIEFVYEIAEAIAKIKGTLLTKSITVIKEEEVQYARKLHCSDGSRLLLYFKQGKSSKIVIEKDGSDIETLLATVEIVKEPKPTTVAVSASYTVKAKYQVKVKEEIISKMQAVEQEKKSTLLHIHYILNILRGTNSLTVTQFISGKILLQGVDSPLVSEVKEIISSYGEISDKEEALTFVPEEQKKVVEEVIEQLDSKFDAYCEDARRRLSGEAYDFLALNDKKQMVSAFALLNAVKGKGMELPLYNPIVYPVAKAFEGFIIKIMINKQFFSLDDYRKKPEMADIGNCLRGKKLEKYIKDTRRDGYICEQLIAAWEGVRCAELHSDPARNTNIAELKSIETAENKIASVCDSIMQAFRILIKEGYTESEMLAKKESSDNKKEEATTLSNKKEIKEIPILDKHIGTDESGKGDYFGPLVIAGVFVTASDEVRLRDIGVRDSKNNSDSRNIDLAKQITFLLGQSKIAIVVIRPERYNSLYSEMGKNLNKTLAWGHARAIEDILARHDCSNAIADQFGDESFIKTALMKKGKNVELLQTPKAERDLAVAAASILARAKFLEELNRLGKIAGEQLLKGASPVVEDVARKIVAKSGNKAVLEKFVKYHFKTTEKI